MGRPPRRDPRLEPGDHAYNTLTRLFVDRAYGKVQATTGRTDGRITLHALRDAVLATADTHLERLAAGAHALYDLLDAERSGTIGREEYRSLLASLSIANSEADIAFAHIDHRGRGQVSRTRFTASYLQFFLAAAPDTPAAWFWGPLPLSVNGQLAPAAASRAPDVT